jgi:integrase
LPDGAIAVTHYSAKICRRFRKLDGRRVASPVWYGRKREGPGRAWQYVKLYADRKSSERAWADLRTRAERLDAGVISVEGERLKLPLREIADAYHADLARQGRDANHVAISRTVIGRAARVSGWVGWRDLSVANVHKLVDDMAAAGATASYRNKVIARLKALAAWATPEGWANPLSKLRRVSERGAVRRRARRAATAAELSALLAIAGVPGYRVKAYALAAYAGLRRNEAAALTWDRVDADQGTVTVPWKQGDGADTIPLHPYVLSLLLPDGGAAPAEGRVLVAVPDLKTLVKDLKRAGVTFADARGQRLDYHALRHTFVTNLSRAGASSVTRRRLARHMHESVNDRYTHADLAEMREALGRVPWPRRAGPPCGHTAVNGSVPVSVFGGSIPADWTGKMTSVKLQLSGPDTQVD